MRSSDRAFACPICGSIPVCVQFTDTSFLVSCPISCISGEYKQDCLDAWDSYRDTREQVLSYLKEEGLADG